MCDDDIHIGRIDDPTVSDRTSAAAAGLGSVARAPSNVTEKDVEVKTADGVTEAALFYPSSQGTWPAVLIWTDILGLRPVFREMGRRLAAQGYVVLIPNPFYRSVRGLVATPGFDFFNPDDRARVIGYRQAMTNEGIDTDAAAYIGFLDAQPQTNKTKRTGVQGYCMGGALAFRTAAVASSRIGAVASFHGGDLTTDAPDSPHLLIPKTDASYLVAIAQNDDEQQPESKDILKAAFVTAGRPATVEVYPANHGWCVEGSQVYDEASAERAWAGLTRLYETSLA